eukprot:6700785-Pyramimonas_sp.AAC.1
MKSAVTQCPKGPVAQGGPNYFQECLQWLAAVGPRESLSPGLWGEGRQIARHASWGAMRKA